jgi:hypothetical protein
MSVVLERTFTLLSGSRPIVSFVAKNQTEARELAREAWFRDDLGLCRSNGEPLWDGQAKLSVRLSTPDETAKLSEATNGTTGQDGIVLAFLVELDATG